LHAVQNIFGRDIYRTLKKQKSNKKKEKCGN
jgi:hypothetical protein